MLTVRPAPPEHYPWIAKRASLVVGSEFRAIEAMDGDRIVGMVGYDGWTPNACSMHVALDSAIAARRLLRMAFGIPFLEVGRGVVTCTILSVNERSLRLVQHLGFRKIARVRDGWAEGVDMVMFEMRRSECRWIQERKAA